MNQWLKSTIFKLVVLFNHWFMPYKVERGRLSSKCGTTKLPKIPTWSNAWPLKQKLSPQLQIGEANQFHDSLHTHHIQG